MKKVVICSSAAFYEKVVALQEELESAGVPTVIPFTAREMKKIKDFTVKKSWYENDADYTKKADLIRRHFTEIENGDIILVVNETKHGQANYIGGNVLMEMAIAFYFNKPLYILNGLPQNSPFEEEIKGFLPKVLNGDLTQLINDASL